MRDKHCAFCKDNGVGRCIAPCYMAKDGTDCIGEIGQNADNPNHHEVPANLGFLDGRGVEVDDRGYKVISNTGYKPDVNPNWKTVWGGANGGK